MTVSNENVADLSAVLNEIKKGDTSIVNVPPFHHNRLPNGVSTDVAPGWHAIPRVSAILHRWTAIVAEHPTIGHRQGRQAGAHRIAVSVARNSTWCRYPVVYSNRMVIVSLRARASVFLRLMIHSPWDLFTLESTCACFRRNALVLDVDSIMMSTFHIMQPRLRPTHTSEKPLKIAFANYVEGEKRVSDGCKAKKA